MLNTENDFSTTLSAIQQLRMEADPILRIIVDNVGVFDNVLRVMMETYDILADEAWWKLRHYFDQNRNTVYQAFIPPIAQAHPQIKVSLTCTRPTVMVTIGEYSQRLVDYYDCPAAVMIDQRHSDEEDIRRQIYVDATNLGLNAAFKTYLRSRMPFHRLCDLKWAFESYLHLFGHLYYTATEEEWCFLIEALEAEKVFRSLILTEIFGHNLYTRASLRALAKYNLLNTEFCITYVMGDSFTTLIYEAILKTNSSMLNLILELGGQDKGRHFMTSPWDEEDPPIDVFNSARELLVTMIDRFKPGDRPPKEEEGKRKRRQLYLRTLHRHNVFQRSPLLMFRQRHWEEYWKQVEAGEIPKEEK
jgi:hypothetical protein